MPKKTIRVRQVRGKQGSTRVQRECLRGLGLRRIGHVVEREDTPSVRGLAGKISHLVEVIEGDSHAS